MKIYRKFANFFTTVFKKKASEHKDHSEYKDEQNGKSDFVFFSTYQLDGIFNTKSKSSLPKNLFQWEQKTYRLVYEIANCNDLHKSKVELEKIIEKFELFKKEENSKAVSNFYDCLIELRNHVEKIDPFMSYSLKVFNMLLLWPGDPVNNCLDKSDLDRITNFINLDEYSSYSRRSLLDEFIVIADILENIDKPKANELDAINDKFLSSNTRLRTHSVMAVRNNAKLAKEYINELETMLILDDSL